MMDEMELGPVCEQCDCGPKEVGVPIVYHDDIRALVCEWCADDLRDESA